MEPAPEKFNIAAYILRENARARGDKTAMVMVGSDLSAQQWSFADIDASVRRLAAGLLSLGLPSRSRVMIRMGNEIGYILTYLAAIAANLVALPSSAQLTAEEVDFILSDSNVSALVLGREFQGERHLRDRLRIIGPSEFERLFSFPAIESCADTNRDDPAYLVYTSGTTRRPKGVLHAQRAVWGRRPMHDHWIGLHESDVLLHAGALNWTYTLGVGVLDPWARGATSIVYNGAISPDVWPRLIERYRATIFAAVPGVYRQILKYCRLDRFDLGSLRHGLSAGEALAPILLQNWREQVRTPLFEAFGMSEVSTFISAGPTTTIRPGSPGRPQPGRRIAILPVDGGSDALGAGQVGLLAVHRSDPALMIGYWNRPDEDAEVYRGEWFIGGDLAALDDDGYVWHHGRHDDLMNSMGYRVSPLEVETVLASLHGVSDVAVTERRVNDDVGIIVAFVVKQADAPLDEAALLSHCAEHLAAYKRPRRIVFLNEIPRSANGKIVRRALPQL